MTLRKQTAILPSLNYKAKVNYLEKFGNNEPFKNCNQDGNRRDQVVGE